MTTTIACEGLPCIHVDEPRAKESQNSFARNALVPFEALARPGRHAWLYS